jgi:hypothetical protein
MIYFNLGKCVDHKNPNTSEETLKQAIKYYQYAVFLFDKLINEVEVQITEKNAQPDLSNSHLTLATDHWSLINTFHPCRLAFRHLASREQIFPSQEYPSPMLQWLKVNQQY